MNKQHNDHMRVVYGLRRQIRSAEKRYNYLKDEPRCITTISEAWCLLANRHALIEVLRAYQLATFSGE